MKKRLEHWTSPFGFVMAAAGSAIGLGTLWMFPYLCGRNGGGAFVLLYLACTFFIGIPVFIAELVLGRKARRAAVGTFEELCPQSPGWKIFGWMGVAASFLIMSYYGLIAGWGLNYLTMALSGSLMRHNEESLRAAFDVLEHSADIGLFWQLFFNLITVAVVYFGIREGIERYSKIMTQGLLLLLTALFGYSFFLQGFDVAWDFIFDPKWDQLTRHGALEALGLSFFTLSLGQGIMLTYGSYLKGDDDVISTALIVGVMDIVVSLLAALMIFPVVFSFGVEPSSGSGLVFKTLPLLFVKLPGGQLIAIAFFLLFVFAALTSSVALVEVVVANCIDLLNWSRRRAAIVVGIAVTLVGIPSALSVPGGLFDSWQLMYQRNFFETLSDLVSTWLLPLGGLGVAIFAGWVVDQESLCEDIRATSRFSWLIPLWLFLLRIVVPIAVGSIIAYKTGVI